MTALKRAFLAIVPPAEVLDAIEGLLERSKSSRYAWTRRDQWHVTVQFFGRVADAEALVAALRESVAAVPPMQVRVRGGGAFPYPRKAQVLWLGVEGVDALAALHAELVGAAGDVLARRDRVAFHAHLTLARLKRATDLRGDVEALAGVAVGRAWTVTELKLFESKTRPEGAVYTEQAWLPLLGDS